jgi:peptidoglycan/xylan/chitin deacetylase (PgdA/CDA1 family)
MKRTPVFWTNDDILYGQSSHMQRQLDFLAQFDIRGDFFVVPKAGAHTLDEDKQLVPMLKAAMAAGHGCYQHGFVHDPYESGIPDLLMLAFSPAVAQRYTDERFQVEAMHTLPALTKMIANGSSIWKRAFGQRSPGYRPGWGSFCGNLYRALGALGFEWVSSRCSSMTSWCWNSGDFSYPDKVLPVGYGPFRIGKLIEYPIAGDYGFRVKRKDIKKFAELGWAQFQACRKLGVPFNLVSHWHGLEFENGTGYAVHEILLKRLKKSGQAEFMTLGEYHERARKTKWPRVALDTGV